jgi:hypothetical protein
MRYRLRTLVIAVVALFSLAAAYRFASHGIPARDGRCIGLACIAVAVAVGVLGFEFWSRQPKGNQPPRTNA